MYVTEQAGDFREALVLACLSLLLAPGTALAGNGNHGGGNSGGSQDPPPPSSSSQGGGSGAGSINAHVTTTTNYKDSGTPLASTDASWTPPTCWYEPHFTSDQYEIYYRNEMKSWSAGEQYVQADWDKLEKERYNKGEDGLWWQRVFNENAPPAFALANCPGALRRCGCQRVTWRRTLACSRPRNSRTSPRRRPDFPIRPSN